MECHECGATVSDKAADCPQCGASLRDLTGGAETDDTTGVDDGGVDDTGVTTDGDDRDAGDWDSESGGSESDRNQPTVPGADDQSGGGPDSADPGESGGGLLEGDTADAGDGPGGTAASGASDGETAPDADATGDVPTGTGADRGTESGTGTGTETGWEAAGPPPEEETETGTDEERGATAGPDEERGAGFGDGDEGVEERGAETGWEAAGPPPEDQETAIGAESNVDAEGTAVGDQETAIGGGEPTVGGSEPGDQGGVGGDSGFGRETDTGGGGPEIPDRTGETGAAGGETGAGHGGGRGTAETGDLADEIRELPFLSGPIAGLVTAAVLAVVSVVVAALDPNPTFDTVSQGAVVLLDLHFAAGFTVEPDLLVAFGIADPRLTPVDLLTASVGILYLLPVIFCYTAGKFLAAYNVDETTPLALAGATGALIAVGYFPVMLVALALAPSGAAADVSLPRAVLLGGLAYPLVFGSLGGLAAGAFSASERRVGTLYGVVAFFLMTIGAFAVTIPALADSDLGLLPQVHASLFTIVSVNGFGLPNPGMSGLVSLGYPLVGGIVFAAGFLRAWNASDVEEPLRGAAKGLSPVATYFVLLGVVTTLLPFLADADVAAGLGLDSAGVTLVRDLVRNDLSTIGQYVFAVSVGTLVYAVFLGGLGGTIAGGVRYALSEDN